MDNAFGSTLGDVRWDIILSYNLFGRVIFGVHCWYVWGPFGGTP
jgi:hypothetical protein